jgi:hypothetical protein
MLLDIETCTPLLRSNIAAEKDGAVEGLRIVHTQVHVWQQKVEAILMAAYSFLPSLLTRADGAERGVLYNDYRILIEQVIVLATRELNLGVVAFGVHSQALHHVHAQRDLHDLLTHHSVGAGALVNPAGRLPPPPPGFATPTGHSLQPNGTFEQYQLPLIVHSTCFVGTGDFCGDFCGGFLWHVCKEGTEGWCSRRGGSAAAAAPLSHCAEERSTTSIDALVQRVEHEDNARTRSKNT